MQARLGIGIGVVLGYIMVGMGSVWAQSPDITVFNANGELTWTNSNTNLFYQVQWAASLSGTGVWRSSYSALQDIQSTNVGVTMKVPMFYRVQGSSNRVVYSAPVAKTGQTPAVPFSVPAGSDGVLQRGVAWPNPRFTDNNDGTVKDNLTGLIWLKDANAFGANTWADALTDCNLLAANGTTLTDGSVAGDWRLPNVMELLSLIDWRYGGPALPNTAGTGHHTSGQPFTGVQSDYYWSSTTGAGMVSIARCVSMDFGYMNVYDKTTLRDAWPVRGGQ